MDKAQQCSTSDRWSFEGVDRKNQIGLIGGPLKTKDFDVCSVMTIGWIYILNDGFIISSGILEDSYRFVRRLLSPGDNVQSLADDYVRL